MNKTQMMFLNPLTSILRSDMTTIQPLISHRRTFNRKRGWIRGDLFFSEFQIKQRWA